MSSSSERKHGIGFGRALTMSWVLAVEIVRFGLAIPDGQEVAVALKRDAMAWSASFAKLDALLVQRLGSSTWTCVQCLRMCKTSGIRAPASFIKALAQFFVAHSPGVGFRHSRIHLKRYLHASHSQHGQSPHTNGFLLSMGSHHTQSVLEMLQHRLGLNGAEIESIQKKVSEVVDARACNTTQDTKNGLVAILPTAVTTERMLDVLKSWMKLSVSELKKVVLGRPQMLCLSMEETVVPSLEAFQNRLRLSDAELKKVVLERPQVLTFDIEQTAFLAALQERLSLSDAELKKVVLINPPVLGLSIEEYVLPSLAALQERLSLSDAELKKVVLNNRQLLGLSIEKNVMPSLAALQERLGLSDEELKLLVRRRPESLSYSIEKNVMPSLAALQERLSLSDAELKKVVLSRPQVLGLNIEKNIMPTLEALPTLLKLSNAELKKVVLLSPAVLGYSTEKNIAPKLKFLQEELQLTPRALGVSILASPKLLSYSLTDWYVPRLKACRLVDAADSTVLTHLTDEKFCAKIGVSLSDLRLFQNEARNDGNSLDKLHD